MKVNIFVTIILSFFAMVHGSCPEGKVEYEGVCVQTFVFECDSVAQHYFTNGVHIDTIYILPSDTRITLHLHDTYADSWNGAELTEIGGSTFTFTEEEINDKYIYIGESPAERQLHYTNPGLYPDEISFKIFCDACQEVGKVADGIGSVCVDSCPTQRPLTNEGVCVDSCPAGKVEDGGVCIDCQQLGKVEDGGVCVECPAEQPVIDEVCVVSCPTERPLNNFNVCVDSCPAGKTLGANNVCICGSEENGPFTNAEQNELYYADSNNICQTISLATLRNVQSVLHVMDECPL